MLKVGVQSGGIFSGTDYDKNFGILADHGFECVDFNIDTFLGGEQIRKGEANGFFDQSLEELYTFFTPCRDAAVKHGIEFSQMHGPFPLWVDGRDEDMNPYVIEATKKCMAVAGFLGCPYIVVHPVNAQWLYGKEREREINLNIYRQLIPAAREYGVKICLENLFVQIKGRCFEGPCADVEEAVWYIDKLNAEAGFEAFSFCLDVGHANLYARNLKEYIKALGHRLGIMHIHDNDGQTDLHMLPYSYVRNNGKDHIIDWDGFIAGLREIGYRGNICFETFRCMSAFPKDVHPQLLDLICALGRHFVNAITAE